MQTIKNKLDRNLTETWLGKHLIRVGQKVDEMWMTIGQYLVKSWSAFKVNKVGQKLDESWMDFHPFRVCQGYANDMPEFRPKKLLQLFSNTPPEITQRRLHQSYTNPTLKFERFSLEMVSQQLPNDYPENEGFSLEISGQSRHEIGIKTLRQRFGKVSVRIRWFQGYKVGQFLGETWVVIQPLSFIVHLFIVHNKRVSFSLFDIVRVSLYVVLPDQKL